jgi:hypothetical protein
LAPPIRLGDALAELIVPAQVDVIEVKAIQEALFLNLPRKLLDFLLDVSLTHLRPD